MRYLPERELPPYAFVPGRDPHPTRDPQGHSYGDEGSPPPHLPAANWYENAPYLWGVDLYNHGYLWEAHEAWEGLWHVAKREDGLQAQLLQGLIQCSAACLKIPMGQPNGLARLSALGSEKLEQVARETGGHHMGLDLPEFVARLRAFASTEPQSIEDRPRIELER